MGYFSDIFQQIFLPESESKEELREVYFSDKCNEDETFDDGKLIFCLLKT